MISSDGHLTKLPAFGRCWVPPQAARSTAGDTRSEIVASPNWKAPGTNINLQAASAGSPGGEGGGGGGGGGARSPAAANTRGLFDFDGSALDSYSLRTLGTGGKPLRRGAPVPGALGALGLAPARPPTSASASLTRRPEALKSAAVSQGRQEHLIANLEPGSPGRPQTALNRHLSTANMEADDIDDDDDDDEEEEDDDGGWARSGGGGGGGSGGSSAVVPLGVSFEALEPPSNLDALLGLDGGEPGSPKAKGPLADRSGFFTNYVLMSELRTSEDAVQYFLRRQSHKFPVKFLHLVPRDPGYSGYYPYDLEVVPQADAEAAPLHYVMTATGVTVFIREGGPADDSSPTFGLPPGAAVGGGGAGGPSSSSSSSVAAATRRFLEAETIILGEWITERNTFNVIMQRLTFFRHYLRKKAFTFWLDGVRRRQFARLRARVAVSAPRRPRLEDIWRERDMCRWLCCRARDK